MSEDGKVGSTTQETAVLFRVFSSYVNKGKLRTTTDNPLVMTSYNESA